MQGKITASFFVVMLACLSLCCGPAWSLTLVPQAQPVPVVMLSDLHFDPFRDPAKVQALRSAPLLQWVKILDDPDSVTAPVEFARLQTACHARGVDSSWAVIKSSLRAAHAQAPSALFVTVSGDLLTHNFDCRLKTLDPQVTPEQVSAFAAKTLAFLAEQMHATFKAAPVYLALGNNDSGCANYHQTPGSEFLRSVDASIAGEFSRAHDQAVVMRAFSERGDYSVLLPKSMHDTRLIVLQDVFASPGFAACGTEAANTDAAAQQLKWLRLQLISAKKDGQKVWVMAHIPPGVDTFASFHRYISKPETLCSGATPVMMLSSDDLAKTLTDFAGTVRLAIFAHTHMDEMKLLHSEQGLSVAAKLVPSISPVNGNKPAFLVAQVQPRTAVMLDYAVYAASDRKASSWNEEYRFSTAYHMPEYSADTVAQIASRLARDKSGTDDLSVTYRRWFLPGDDGEYARGLKAIWPSYACAVQEDGGPAFHECMCPTSAAPSDGKAAQ